VKWLSRFILRYAGTVALTGSLLGIMGGYYSIELYKNLKTDIHELLPTEARSVIDLKEVSSRLQSIESLAILVFSNDTQASKRFVIDLADKLETLPSNVIAGVEYRIDRELQFFKDRQTLYLDLSDLTRIRDYISQKIEYEKALYNPLNIFSEESIPEPILNFLEIKSKYKGRSQTFAAFEHLPGGFYATEDEKKRLILAKLPGESSGIEGAHQLKNAVAQAVQSLNPTSYASDIKIEYSGDIEDLIEEQTALVEDLEISTVIVTLIVTAGMLLFYRTLRATFALMLSLLMGTLWTFGVSYFVVGYLNANSAFLGSIIIGNGINFGIIYLARYLEERRNHKNCEEATELAMSFTATSTWTAALAAGLSYGSLMLTGFRGFKQFGVIGLIGMVLCWLSAFTVLPAYLALLDRRRSLIARTPHPPKPYLAGAFASIIQKFPRIIWGVSIAISLMSVAALFRYDGSILETDLSKLRNKESMEKGSVFWSQYVDQILQRYLSPLAILPNDRQNAREIAARLKEKMKKDGETSLISKVMTLDDIIPAHQEEKIAVLRQIKALLTPQILKHLSPSDRELVNHFLNEHVFHTMTEQDLPKLVMDLFTEKDGSVGKLVLVEPPLNHVIWEGSNLIRFIDTLREIADSVEPGAPVAGSNAVSSDMIRSIAKDGPKATLFAFLAVILLVIFLFRSLKTITLVLFSLILGVLWLGGLIMGFDFKINFLNFIALPITFGIGVDYGVNIFQRYRETGSGTILEVVKSTGSAVGLCSFSTIVGYMSLLIARNQGFVSFGFLAVVGELTCVVAAVLSLPAYLYLKDQKAKKREKTEAKT
jgi:uncharacterized protein